MFKELPTVHGHKVIAFAHTETQSTGPCGIILVQKLDGEYVTAWYRLGDSEWVHGHYFHGEEARKDAYKDFMDRTANSPNRLGKPFPERKTPAELGITRQDLWNLSDSLADTFIVDGMLKLEDEYETDRYLSGQRVKYMLSGAGYTEEQIKDIATVAKMDYNEEEIPSDSQNTLKMIKDCKFSFT